VETQQILDDPFAYVHANEREQAIIRCKRCIQALKADKYPSPMGRYLIILPLVLDAGMSGLDLETDLGITQAELDDFINNINHK
jgi:hypothetical protein